MAAAVIIVYKTAILYETNIRLNYYNILNYRSGGERWRIDNNIAMAMVNGRRCLLFYCII